MYKQLVEETTGGMIGPVTSQGNPSVAYLPGGFSTMKNMLKSLSPIKRKWKLEVLESEGNYDLKIEDAIDIKIAKKDYKEFNEKVYNVVGQKELNLTGLLNEGRAEEAQQLHVKIAQILKNKITSNSISKQSIVLMNYWISLFPNSKFVSINNLAAISLNKINSSIADISKSIQELYSEDVGQLEIILAALEKNQPLNTFEPFSNYEYLMGAKISSVYNGINLELTLLINVAMVPVEYIITSDEDLLNELSAYRTLRVVKGKIYPGNLMFNPGTFENLKKNIDDIEGIKKNV